MTIRSYALPAVSLLSLSLSVGCQPKDPVEVTPGADPTSVNEEPAQTDAPPGDTPSPAEPDLGPDPALVGTWDSTSIQIGSYTYPDLYSYTYDDGSTKTTTYNAEMTLKIDQAMAVQFTEHDVFTTEVSADPTLNSESLYDYTADGTAKVLEMGRRYQIETTGDVALSLSCTLEVDELRCAGPGLYDASSWDMTLVFKKTTP